MSNTFELKIGGLSDEEFEKLKTWANEFRTKAKEEPLPTVDDVRGTLKPEYPRLEMAADHGYPADAGMIVVLDECINWQLLSFEALRRLQEALNTAFHDSGNFEGNEDNCD